MSLHGPAVLAVAFVSLALHSAAAQSGFPARPITIVVPTAAGGAADGAARTVANQLAVVAKQPIIVDNRPGAGGTLAAMYAAKAAPDGYTIFLGTNSTHAASVSLFKSLQYDPVNDFAPITRAESAPAFLVVNPGSPIRSADEFLRAVRRKPGEVSIAVFSLSGVVAATMLRAKANIDFLQIPYKAPTPAISDLLGGRVDALFCDALNTVTLAQSQQIRALAATSRARSPVLSDVPTMIESGVPDYEMVSWGAFFAPRATPPEIIAALNRLLHATYATEPVQATIARLGQQVHVSSPEELAVFLRGEIPKWSEMIRASGYEQQ
jgi:tripartite-type tricarboxylate transporter receptor subunit TctC